jgi:hypothetical protein
MGGGDDLAVYEKKLLDRAKDNFKISTADIKGLINKIAESDDDIENHKEAFMELFAKCIVDNGNFKDVLAQIITYVSDDSSHLKSFTGIFTTTPEIRQQTKKKNERKKKIIKEWLGLGESTNTTTERVKQILGTSKSKKTVDNPTDYFYNYYNSHLKNKIQKDFYMNQYIIKVLLILILDKNIDNYAQLRDDISALLKDDEVIKYKKIIPFIFSTTSPFNKEIERRITMADSSNIVILQQKLAEIQGLVGSPEKLSTDSRLFMFYINLPVHDVASKLAVNEQLEMDTESLDMYLFVLILILYSKVDITTTYNLTKLTDTFTKLGEVTKEKIFKFITDEKSYFNISLKIRSSKKLPPEQIAALSNNVHLIKIWFGVEV